MVPLVEDVLRAIVLVDESQFPLSSAPWTVVKWKLGRPTKTKK